MDKTKDILTVAPPENLYFAVISRIGSEKKKTAMRQIIYTGVAILLSVFAFVEAFFVMLGSLARSGFYNYFSLIFSDGFALASSWKDFVFSLVESFSFFEFFILLSLVFVVLVSIRLIVKNMKIFYATAMTA